jgi:hypothetical protein
MRSATPYKKACSLPASIAANFRAATQNTSWAASSNCELGTPSRRSKRQIEA